MKRLAMDTDHGVVMARGRGSRGWGWMEVGKGGEMEGIRNSIDNMYFLKKSIL